MKFNHVVKPLQTCVQLIGYHVQKLWGAMCHRYVILNYYTIITLRLGFLAYLFSQLTLLPHGLQQ